MLKVSRLNFVGAIALWVTLSSTAHALPILQLPTDLARGFTPEIYGNANYNYDGIVALDDCSGSVIRLEASKDTDLALVLTNGHCSETGFTPAGQHLSHIPSSRRFALTKANGDRAGVISASEIVYATMTGTDIALYKTNLSYADLATRYGVHPLTLASSHPAPASPIEIISGYWHRGYSCVIDAFVPVLREDEWTWADSIRYSRPGCETIGGTSGSPIIAASSRTMVGINNTGNTSGGVCTLNNPCEVLPDGRTSATQGNTYGQETYSIYTCINAANEFDLSVPGCKLVH